MVSIEGARRPDACCGHHSFESRDRGTADVLCRHVRSPRRRPIDEEDGTKSKSLFIRRLVIAFGEAWFVEVLPGI